MFYIAGLRNESILPQGCLGRVSSFFCLIGLGAPGLQLILFSTRLLTA